MVSIVLHVVMFISFRWVRKQLGLVLHWSIWLGLFAIWLTV